MGDLTLCGVDYFWTDTGIVGAVDDRRYIADDFGGAVAVPFSSRDDEYLEH